MIENGMVVGAEAEWERICERPDYWEDSRNAELVFEFADAETALEAMMYWIRTEDCDEDRLYELFEALDYSTQYLEGIKDDEMLKKAQKAGVLANL